MAQPIQPSAEPPADKDSDYDSNEDEDFQDAASEANLSSSSSDAEDPDTTQTSVKKVKATSKKRKATAPPEAQVEADLDSGDEATIREFRKKKHKRRKADKEAGAADADDDSGGEGGLIKTRAQRRTEKIERAEFKKANVKGATVDVDALWNSLSSVPIGRRVPTASKGAEQTQQAQTTEDGVGASQDMMDIDTTGPAEDDEMVTIKLNYGFAGQTVSEEKRVHRDSAEAKLYLASQKHPTTSSKDSPTTRNMQNGIPLRRPLKRQSMFEPNPTGEVKGLQLQYQRLRTPSRADVLAMQKRADEEQEKKNKAQRLNTVQKSAIDWAQHVDKEGLKDELQVYGKSKGGYLDKMDFLKDVEGRRDLEERRARLAR